LVSLPCVWAPGPSNLSGHERQVGVQKVRQEGAEGQVPQAQGARQLQGHMQPLLDDYGLRLRAPRESASTLDELVGFGKKEAGMGTAFTHLD